MSTAAFRFCIYATFTSLVFSLNARSESLETHDNPVSDGTIRVVAGDTDRKDWDGIPWYEEDFEDELFPVDIDSVRVAHDSQNVYFQILTHQWEVDELWRVGLYLDTDQDPETGYNGDFLAIGVDHFIEENVVSEFAAASQTEWGWEETANNLSFDQTSLLDKEIAIPREALDNALSFDFLLFANNFCCDFQEPNDAYPDTSQSLGGDFFTYELSDVSLRGDFDSDNTLDLADVSLLSAEVATGGNDVSFDLNGDRIVDSQDLENWIRDIKGTWIGDSNLDGEFNSSDLVAVFQASEYEDSLAMNSKWNTGDWNGDAEFDTSDLVVAFQDGGFELGPRTGTRPVPEPANCLMFMLVIAMLVGRQTRTPASCVNGTIKHRPYH